VLGELKNIVFFIVTVRENIFFYSNYRWKIKTLEPRHAIWSIESTTDTSEDLWKKIWRDENVVNGLLVNDPT